MFDLTTFECNFDLSYSAWLDARWYTCDEVNTVLSHLKGLYLSSRDSRKLDAETDKNPALCEFKVPEEAVPQNRTSEIWQQQLILVLAESTSSAARRSTASPGCARPISSSMLPSTPPQHDESLSISGDHLLVWDCQDPPRGWPGSSLRTAGLVFEDGPDLSLRTGRALPGSSLETARLFFEDGQDPLWDCRDPPYFFEDGRDPVRLPGSSMGLPGSSMGLPESSVRMAELLIEDCWTHL
ncbi:hypothetical protein FISHEDRAFT_73734 [Fistulina hepatica ATCC 64428]|uniref:Uncharacterized protein n=1 Tax=Fistulina hepatica ATCC 64428 TaxID=1128425 RepID=A0A0D7ABW3_9AGAR|nr:hypothetical protein FISHEDRAFT_73734 [Fistulina hepatica ATCC 64428]